MIEITGIEQVKEHIDDIQVVIFDLDDTLYSEREYVWSGLEEVSRYIRVIKRGRMKMWDAYCKGKPAIDEVLKSEGVYTDKLKEMCLEIYRNHKPKIRLYKGVRVLLAHLKQNGIRTGIITDGRPEGQRSKLAALGLLDMEKIIITDELGGVEFRKPCKDAFVKMQEYFGVPYEKMCYVGDNISKDFVAPEQLGMKCIWFRNPDGIYQ